VRQATDPLDSLALFLVHTFGRDVSPTLVLDVFAALCVIVIAVAFIHSIKKIRNSHNNDHDDYEPGEDPDDDENWP